MQTKIIIICKAISNIILYYYEPSVLLQTFQHTLVTNTHFKKYGRRQTQGKKQKLFKNYNDDIIQYNNDIYVRTRDLPTTHAHT